MMPLIASGLSFWKVRLERVYLFTIDSHIRGKSLIDSCISDGLLSFNSFLGIIVLIRRSDRADVRTVNSDTSSSWHSQNNCSPKYNVLGERIRSWKAHPLVHNDAYWKLFWKAVSSFGFTDKYPRSESWWRTQVLYIKVLRSAKKPWRPQELRLSDERSSRLVTSCLIVLSNLSRYPEKYREHRSKDTGYRGNGRFWLHLCM
jgi:hypothetical protein